MNEQRTATRRGGGWFWTTPHIGLRAGLRYGDLPTDLSYASAIRCLRLHGHRHRRALRIVGRAAIHRGYRAGVQCALWDGQILLRCLRREHES